MLVRKSLSVIPNKHYTIHFDKDLEEYYGVEIPTPKDVDKIYRDNSQSINRWKSSFNSINKNLGIVINGIQGSGKTLMAFEFFKEMDLPVLHVREPFSGNMFTQFINSLDQEVIIFFDEFEKVYHEEKSQEELLTLLDGGYNSKKIFVLVSNKNKLNEYFYNRPSRIRFLEEFTSIEPEVLQNIIDDLLEDKEHEQEIKDIVTGLGASGNDLIISLIQQVNIEGESPRECLKHMNIKIPPINFDYIAYIQNDDTYRGTYYGHPLSGDSLTFRRWDGHGFQYDEFLSAMFETRSQDEIILQDSSKNKFVFTRKEKFDFKKVL